MIQWISTIRSRIITHYILHKVCTYCKFHLLMWGRGQFWLIEISHKARNAFFLYFPKTKAKLVSKILNDLSRKQSPKSYKNYWNLYRGSQGIWFPISVAINPKYPFGICKNKIFPCRQQSYFQNPPKFIQFFQILSRK